MEKDNRNMYEEWLTTIANTRLVFNTMSELENMLDNHSIHNNGIKRCYNTTQKLRATFRDLKEEVSIITNDDIDLDYLMDKYKQAWEFYRNNLIRRSSPETIALNLLSYIYPPYRKEGINKKFSLIFESVLEQNIDVPILFLLLMKAIPGYDSKDGDIVEMNRKYEEVMVLLDKITGNSELFTTLPAINISREEENKSRLMLLYHTSKILDVYKAYCESNNLYDTANTLKQSRVPLDIAGFWNECDGKMESTTFWEVIPTITDGAFFLIKWQKKADNTIVKIKYTLVLNESSTGDLVIYLAHPESLYHRMKSLPYGDSDHVWYHTEMPLDISPTELSLKRLLSSSIWRRDIKLTKVSDESCVSIYEKWIDKCEIENPYSIYEYEYHPDIYAVTKDYIYIKDEEKELYYKVPKSSYDGFENIQISDDVGILTMNGKKYLAFDDFMLYINTSKNQLNKYGIETVNHIE